MSARACFSQFALETIVHTMIRSRIRAILVELSTKLCLPVISVTFQGVGTVISGTCLQGTIHLNEILLLGPDSLGQFAPVAIKGIHRKRMPVREVRGGQTCSFALKKVGA